MAEAVCHLIKEGLPLRLDLVGGLAHPPTLQKLKEILQKLSPYGQEIHYLGPLPYSKMPEIYHDTDLFVFASSCENLPIILLEAMASGLPIACSEREPMPEVLGEGGIYFNPENSKDIAQALGYLIHNQALRKQSALAAFERAKPRCGLQWPLCQKLFPSAFLLHQ